MGNLRPLALSGCGIGSCFSVDVDSDPALHSDADPDSASQNDANPDSASQNDADSSGSAITEKYIFPFSTSIKWLDTLVKLKQF